MPTIVPPPISTVEAETRGFKTQEIKIHGMKTLEIEIHGIEIQGIEIHGIKIHEIEIHGLNSREIKIKGAWTSANPWHLDVTLPAATGIETTKKRAQKSAAVHRAPRIPGTMAPECLDVTALC
jgi:hypothetical protein